MKKFAPPEHLSPAAKRLWRSVHEQYQIDDAPGLALLQALCEARDRCDQAREQILVDGAVVTDRFGQRKVHPAVLIERDARAQVIAAIRALRLAPDVEERR